MTFLLGLLLIRQPFPATDGVIQVPLGEDGKMAVFSVWSYEIALVLSYVLLFAAIYLFLKVQKKAVRTIKTLTAYLGVELFFILLLAIAIKFYMVFILLLLILWKVATQSYIIKEALNTQSIVGVLLAINLEIIKIIPFMVIFAPQLSQAGGAG